MLLVTALILILIVFIAAVSRKLNVPLIIIALAAGIFFGSDVTGVIYFDDAVLAKELANIALVFILFAGGFSTKNYHLRPAVRPTIMLATLGVLITSIVTAFVFSLSTGWALLSSALLCAIISSTDAAAVFSILRTRSINPKITVITEAESASNDPMAIVLTTFILQLVIGSSTSTHYSILLFIWQLVGGVGIGFVVGSLGAHLFNKIKDVDVGYFYIFLIGVVLLSYGLADLLMASGMLSVFFAGFVMGNRNLPYKNGVSSFTQALSFIANVGLFVLLGLLVFPSKFSEIWIPGVLLFVTVTFIGRPVAVFLCTIGSGVNLREKAFLSWSGIRGAVPIVLATYPAAVGIDADHKIFNIVFFAVTLSILFQGTTIARLADLLRLSFKKKTRPKQTMELVTVHDTNYELIEIFIDDDIYRGEARISDIPFPSNTTVTMINRDNSIIAPLGQTSVRPGDVLSVLVDRKKIEDASIAVLGMFTKKRA